MVRIVSAGRWPLLALCAALFTTSAAQAQSTDGYHAIQVLPVVVDSASFTQRIILRNPMAVTQHVSSTYYPADGTTQATPINCPEVTLMPQTAVTVAGLRALCPEVAGGSQFGTVVLRTGNIRPFAVYSRVSNAAGAGFSVEGFPAQTFTSATTAVTGLRRLAATADAPAYQTNCFVGNLGEYTPSQGGVAADVTLKLQEGVSTIGQTVVSIPAGRLVRLVDVFATAGVAAGDHDNVTATFATTSTVRPGLLAFCTVQDNTSFGADFRIGKVERGRSGLLVSQDATALRNVAPDSDYKFTGEATTRAFVIPAGHSRNVHSYYFRHPDVVDCEVIDPNTQEAAAPSYGLEMRLLAMVSGGEWQVVAGGSDVASFSGLYMGDKPERGGGMNTRYMLEVESNGLNEGVDRPYWLYCASGSGTTMGEMVLTGAPVVF